MDVHFAENGISTSDKVMRRESFRELIADVHQLPETQRTALLLREIDAMSYEQIAQAMETTVPSVKSLLVRARISLAEAAEARQMSCDEVRLELGEVAEGLSKLSTPARRHVRGCERCGFFKKQLRENNHALAMIMPVGPLLLVKKLLLAKLGTTASAGGAHVAGGAGATVGAGATAGAAATGGASLAGGVMTAGAGALATKAAAGLAAAAIVAAGAVAADHAVVPAKRHTHRTLAGRQGSYAQEPVVVHELAQPVSATVPAHRVARTATLRHAPLPPVAAATTTASAQAAPVTPATAPPVATPVTAPDPSTPPAPQVTEVNSQTTQLPPQATAPPATPPTTATPPPAGPLPTAEPVPVPDQAPSGETATTTTAPSPPPPPPSSSTGGAEAPPAPPPEAPAPAG
jgi:hypothetical protein